MYLAGEMGVAGGVRNPVLRMLSILPFLRGWATTAGTPSRLLPRARTHPAASPRSRRRKVGILGALERSSGWRYESNKVSTHTAVRHGLSVYSPSLFFCSSPSSLTTSFPLCHPPQPLAQSSLYWSSSVIFRKKYGILICSHRFFFIY